MSPTNQRGYDLLVALCSASCDMSHETEGTICFGHWVLHLVISHTRQGLRFVNGIGFCVFWNHTRDRRFDLLRALGLASCDLAYERAGVTICCGHWTLHLEITHLRRGTICYGHWALHLEITHRCRGTFCYGALCSASCDLDYETAGLRFVTGIGFRDLWYHTRDRGYDLLRALGSASCDLTHETGGMICFENTRHWVRFVTGIGFCDSSVSCDIIHETEGTICYKNWVLHLVITPANRWYDLLCVLGSASCDLTHGTGGTICYARAGLCTWWYHSRDMGCALLRALCAASCDLAYETAGVRFVAGIGFCAVSYHTQDKGYDLLRALGSASCDLA